MKPIKEKAWALWNDERQQGFIFPSHEQARFKQAISPIKKQLIRVLITSIPHKKKK